ncbi:Rv3654c family TadE-like protein [Jiangella asiatica]|uniref:Putative Flp pilus-assembly TadG-like N-terminal domain-containing protein n=1 Tax=Jiangella asiatica TaxID=2530372 RepID=A0A4R5CC79_9ACTN|nr:Rv3654c family TadE-like protein [Jiangella asiatica]TDD94754.1 hypothetical protein E1269_31695 [Jiangella asiatica]
MSVAQGSARREHPARRRPRGRSQRGAGTVLVLLVVMVVLTALLGVGVLATGHTARRQAAAAADLAALAAARRLASGEVDPCAEAERIARANGAALCECVVDGLEVEVQVRVATASGMPWLPDQDRRARAGPPRADGVPNTDGLPRMNEPPGLDGVA